SAEARDPRAIFQRGVFRPQETWLDAAGQSFNPGNYYYVGGNSKLYGAVLLRYRAQDFAPVEHREGSTPGWPFSYDELEPWYTRAERLYQVRGALGVDIEIWLKRAPTPWDAFPDTGTGKMDAESCGLAEALRHPNVELRENTKVERLLPDAGGKRLKGVDATVQGERKRILAGTVILSAGAVNSAALLLASADGEIANRSGAVGRHFMNHNCSAVLAIDPRTVNDSVYQKTLGINDFYLDDGNGGPPLGNIQLLGRVTAPILKSNLPRAPEWALSLLTRRAVDWYAMSEDLPNPASRVTVRGGQIHLDWKRSNWSAHEGLVKTFKERLKAAGYPIVLSKPFDRRTPSHQCGTVRIGNDPKTAPLDPFCRAWDHPNLFVVDASFLPTSAAVNPALTIAAQALRVADHIAKSDLH